MAFGRKGLLGLQAEFERLLQHVFERGPMDGPLTAWSPAADVFVAGGHVVVRFELSGVRRSEIDLTFADGELRVRGARLDGAGEKKEGYWQMEIPHGPFDRVVKIPLPVDASAIDAQTRDGILEVRLPLLAGAKKSSHES